jgi:Flp pilus assembly protein CpaB
VKRSNRLVILVGVLLAVLAFVGIVILLNQRGPGTGGGEVPTTVTVMIANEAIAIGDPVTPDLVTPTEVDPSEVVGTPIGNPSQLGGQPALVNIPAQSQVSFEAIAVGGATCVSCQLNAGEKAIAFQVDRVTGLDFLIQSGDMIDVVISEQLQVLQPTLDTADDPPNQQRFETIPGLENARTVKTILQNKRVLYVSATRVRQTAPAPSASPGAEAPTAEQPQVIENVIIVFAGTDQDAELIKFAQNDLSELGSLTAVLRSADDTETERTTGMTIDQLIEDYGVPIPNIVVDLGNQNNR